MDPEQIGREFWASTDGKALWHHAIHLVNETLRPFGLRSAHPLPAGYVPPTPTPLPRR